MRYYTSYPLLPKLTLVSVVHHNHNNERESWKKGTALAANDK